MITAKALPAVREFQAPVGRALNVLEALEFEPYAVAVADTLHGRIFTVRGVNLRKHSEGHLERVVDNLEGLAGTTRFKRLVIAGTTDGASMLFRLLPKNLRGRVIATAGISADSSESHILNEVLFLARKAERGQEIERAERVITASEKRQKAVTGFEAAIRALNEKCVRELVFAEGFAATGGACAPCHALFESAATNCRFCRRPVKPVEDLVEAAVGSALEQGTAVEQLRGEAADILATVGGVGAFLRF
jgi:peptide subunit release factor 1 (eRF1)